MTKSELLQIVAEYDDDEDVDEVIQEYEQRKLEAVEELEERQHQSGFYAFQDMMEMWRREK